MANTSAIFKGAYTKLLTKLGLGLEAGQKIKYTDGAAAGVVPVSDVNGTLSLNTLAGGGVNTGLTQGSVAFAGTSGVIAQDNANFFWDETNKRLGLRTSPTVSFDTRGAIRAYGPQTNRLTASRTAVAGGSLADGTWWYAVVALDSDGIPTLWRYRAESVTVAAPNSTVRLTWLAMNNAVGYRVYRGTTANSTTGTWVYFNVGDVLTFDDVGDAGTAGAPPTTLEETTLDGRIVGTGGVDISDSTGRSLLKNGMITGTAYADASTLDLFGGYWAFTTTGYYGGNGPLLVMLNSPTFTGYDANPVNVYTFRKSLNGNPRFIFNTDPFRMFNYDTGLSTQFDMNPGVTPASNSVAYSFNCVSRQDTTAGARLFDWSAWTRNSGVSHGFIDSNCRLALNMGSTTTATAQIEARCASATTIGQIIRGATSQTANLAEWQNSGGSAIASVCALGCGKFTGMQLGIRTVTSAPTLTAADYTVLCDCTSGAITATLPAAASSSGRILVFKKIDSSANAMTLDGNASETIDGALTQSTIVQYQTIRVQCDGSAWYTI